MDNFYHPAQRELQDKFDSRRLADRVADIIVHDSLTDSDRAFIESRDMLFLSTVDPQGRPTVSYKGGEVGFVKVLDDKTIAFAGYDGNGMFLSAGNISANAAVGLLFIDFNQPQRLRLHGAASVSTNDDLMNVFIGATYIIRITVRDIFINCSRYIHRYEKIESSHYIPKAHCEPPIPEWKQLDIIQDVLPKPTR